MRSAFGDPLHAAELAVFERKKLSLDAAATARLPGRFETVRVGGLRASMATANQYGFLNTIEGLKEQSVETLPDLLKRFPTPDQATIVATSPSQSLIDLMLDNSTSWHQCDQLPTYV